MNKLEREWSFLFLSQFTPTEAFAQAWRMYHETTPLAAEAPNRRAWVILGGFLLFMS